MKKLAVLILEDEPEVRQAIQRDLIDMVPSVRLEPAEDVADAREVVEEILASGDMLALASATTACRAPRAWSTWLK